MRKLYYSFLLLISINGFSQQFTPGNIAVFVAAGSTTNTTGSIAELNTTAAGQAPVTARAIDGTTPGIALRFSGSATSIGYLANSNDGTLLSFTGHNTTTASGNINVIAPRGVGVYNAAGTFNLAATYTGVTSGQQTRGATSLNNSTWYIADQNGFYSNGTSTPGPSGNFRAVKSFGGTVYVSSASGSAAVIQVNTISAATGGTVTGLPGLGNNANLQDFYLVQSGANGNAYDILYVLSATGNTAGTIAKYSLVSGSWAANGSYTTSFGGFGLAAKKSGGGAELFVSTGQGALSANNVTRCTDAAGYNATISISTAGNVILYTATAGTVVKGVAFAPVALTLPTVNLSVSTNTASEAAATIVTVTATASAAVSGNQTVSLGVTGTGITAGDYSLSNNTITIPDGATTGTVTFTIVDDADAEGTETATLTISNPSPGITLGATTSQNITITDNDMPLMRITEYMYDGANLEFIEFTNVGNTAIDMNGWSYDDNSRVPGSLSLSAFGVVQPGESVILAESSAADFRTAWGLCNAIKIIGGSTQNLGRNDEINLYDASGDLVDRLTYGDQDFPGTIRTQNRSGWVNAAGLGANTIANWTLSAVADAEFSFTSSGGDIGSPGKSARATVLYNPCPPGVMRITEYMYDGANAEFIEFTNTGSTTVDMAGYSFDDDSRIAGTVNLSAFGIVQPGESVILAESSAADFRTAWGLCNGIKIIGGLSTNLGRNDEINLYNASGDLVDRLTYGDQNFPGTIRTQNRSGWVNAAGLGANTIANWTLSAVADAEFSFTSSGGDIGSPGKSSRATVIYNPCPPPGVMRITEYMYDGANAEFIEFTNTGSTTVDMAGYSFDDDSRIAGTVNLSAFGIVQPGESVILAESSAADFRTAWGLCNGIKIIGGLSTNLGRNDEINLYNASGDLVDRLTYGDQNFPGTIRTQNRSGWVNAAGLGANTIANWTLSAVADAEFSFTSSGGDIGSPGKSARATVIYDPCMVAPGAPVIVIDVTNTTDYLDGGAAISPASPYAISGVSNDPSDPAGLFGIDFTIDDDVTPVGSLTVTVSSSNTTVVPNANLVLTGTGASRNLKITPAGVGYTNITVTVNDGANNTSYILNYAASLSSSSSPGKHWHTGNADASAAIALDDDYMAIADDEKNLFFVFDRNQSGLRLKTYDYNQGNILALTDGSAGNWKEVDVEAGVNSIANAGRIYWLGSMSNSSNAPFEDKPNRNRLFAVTAAGTGAATVFAGAGHYSNLRQQLVNWGNANGYNFSASAANNKDPKLIDGFNVEGMVFGPDDATMYIGFRAPLVPTGARTKALIAPIQNFETWFNNGSPVGNPTFDSPIELDLGGRGIRDMIRLSNGNYIILAGSYDEALNPAVYKWTGNAADAALQIPSFNVSGLNIEGVLPVYEGGQLSLNKLQFISDDGARVYYGDGAEAKDLPLDNFKKFSSDIIVSGGSVLPVKFEYFTANRQDNKTVSLKWKTGQTDNLQAFEILRSVNGRDFGAVAAVSAVQGQHIYAYTDNNAVNEKLYYRIKATETGNREYLSEIRPVNLQTTGIPVQVYPNPVYNNRFTVSVNKNGNKTVQVYSVNGTFLYKEFYFTGQSKDINTNLWPKGFYIIRIITDEGMVAEEKLIVQ